MSEILEYKCPACGGAMEFDSATQKMKCPYCDTEISVKDYQKAMKGQRETDTPNEPAFEEADGAAGSEYNAWEANSSGEWMEGEPDGMRIYSCKSCGGEIVAEETTGATTCPFCGNRVVMKGQFSGDLRPDYIIPFKLDKKAAKTAYQKHLKGKHFLPKIFKKENHIDEIKGVYVPFWVFDAEVDANITYNAEKTRTWEERGLEYTEHNYYELQRRGSIRFEKVPTDCSKKMDDNLMESIEPYNFSNAVPFETAYLAGYLADRYDVEPEKCIGHATKRAKASTEFSFSSTIDGYQSVSPAQSNIRVKSAKYWYTLYPVWILNTTWNKKKFIFAMNGQTGKMVGDLPSDQKEFWKYVVKRGLCISVLLYVLQWMLVLA